MTTENNPAVWAGYEAPEGEILGWRVVHPDGRSSHGFTWPFKGVVTAPAKSIDREHQGACPSRVGDGLCVALGWSGAASGGIPASTGLAISYRVDDVLGTDYKSKCRVSRCRVLGPIDLQRLLREGRGTGADLTGADLSEADLTRADLTRADLTGANLTGANLTGADLTGADLTRDGLTRANLTGADLSEADLTRANLTGANLTRADLTGANLTGANLTGANLTGADLTGADLTRAGLTRADLTWAINVPESVKR